jgi:hypothetical protein
MQFNLDKRFIQILNEQGHQLTWEQLRAAYEVRKAEREADPAAIAKRRTEALRNERELERYRALLADQRSP